MKKLLLTVAMIATTAISFAQDAISWVPKDGTYTAGTTIPIELKYTSDIDIPAEAIILELWTVTGGTWSQSWRRATKNWGTILPAGTDQTATITFTALPGAMTTNGLTGGTVMTDAQLTTANPNNVPTATSTYYEVRISFLAGSGFSPTSPGTNFIHITAPLSTNESSLKSINIFPNPVKETLNIPNYSEYKSLSIYNLLGKEVKSFKAQEAVNVSELSSGVYLLKSDNGSSSKCIKE